MHNEKAHKIKELRYHSHKLFVYENASWVEKPIPEVGVPDNIIGFDKVTIEWVLCVDKIILWKNQDLFIEFLYNSLFWNYYYYKLKFQMRRWKIAPIYGTYRANY